MKIVKSAESEKLSEDLTKLLINSCCVHTCTVVSVLQMKVYWKHVFQLTAKSVCSNKNTKDITVTELKSKLKKLKLCQYSWNKRHFDQET